MAVTVGASPPTAAQKTALKSAFDLGNVNNTSDADKPVSVATQIALDARLMATNCLSELATDLATQEAAQANLGLGAADPLAHYILAKA